ncbi:hypothetical protein EBB54_29235 [Schaedlerella arabinosiphila]|uniref:TIGR04255 family protein n=1 Tax=Schaedlerella arabinosiphila TaxID=2044587 RepID=A0A426DQ96_9FIRM|nr:hypothetical protein [Schaedlerella arabinosiphila]RRK34965.1 hypothetical protein EBB54_29235 [Schaedlerella arabinosiphila]
MKSPNVNIYKVQMVYFFREKSEIRAFGLISSLYNQLKDVFKTEPQSIPIPDDAPDDVPRCVWNDVNTSLTFNKLRLDFSFNIPSRFNWEHLLVRFNDKITNAFDECDVIIDRVGLVSELMSFDNLHNLLNEYVKIDKFNGASEVNMSWLENIDLYNVWTYIIINESKNENKIIFDINSLPDSKLSEQGVLGKEAISRCAEKLKGKMLNVL